MKLDAAIFDFDGTLVDTMPIHYEAYRLTFAEVGIELSASDFWDNIGGRAIEAIPKFLRGRPSPLGVDELHTRKKQIVVELFDSVEVPLLDTAKLLPLLHGRVPMAIASSGARVGLMKIVERLQWSTYFGAIVTGEDVARGKPAPDAFLRAAELLEVDPSRCLAFEDTDDGVASAREAGMTVIDVRSR
jgi:HAD superfamily hydrolase (TIGR01509 family)